MYHPILLHYAELNKRPSTDSPYFKKIIADIEASFEYDDREAIDHISWGRMAMAIGDKDITDDDFAEVYMEGWDTTSKLYHLMQEIIRPVDFTGKNLEDYM
jgi:hypothetical protein